MLISSPSSTNPPRSIASSESASGVAASCSSACTLPAAISAITKPALRIMTSPILPAGPVRQSVAQSRAPQPLEQRCTGQSRPVTVCQKACPPQIQMTPDDKRRTIPVRLELAPAIGLEPPGGVPHEHLMLTDSLDDDEVAVASQGYQRNHRYPHLLPQLGQR